MSALTASFSFAGTAPRARPAQRVLVGSDVRGVPKRETVAIDRPQGRRITCIAGCVWLTQDNDPRDIVLEPGDSHLCAGNGRLLVFGLQRSSIAVS